MTQALASTIQMPITTSKQPSRVHNVLQAGTQWFREVKEVAQGHRTKENGWTAMETVSPSRGTEKHRQQCSLLAKPPIWSLGLQPTDLHHEFPPGSPLALTRAQGTRQAKKPKQNLSEEG